MTSVMSLPVYLPPLLNDTDALLFWSRVWEKLTSTCDYTHDEFVAWGTKITHHAQYYLGAVKFQSPLRETLRADLAEFDMALGELHGLSDRFKMVVSGHEANVVSNLKTASFDKTWRWLRTMRDYSLEALRNNGAEIVEGRVERMPSASGLVESIFTFVEGRFRGRFGLPAVVLGGLFLITLSAMTHFPKETPQV